MFSSGETRVLQTEDSVHSLAVLKKKRISRILSEHYYIGNKSLSLDSELECDIFYRSLKTIVDRRSQKGLRSFAIIWKHAYAIVCDRDHAIKRGSCDHMETKVLRSKRIP